MNTAQIISDHMARIGARGGRARTGELKREAGRKGGLASGAKRRLNQAGIAKSGVNKIVEK